MTLVKHATTTDFHSLVSTHCRQQSVRTQFVIHNVKEDDRSDLLLSWQCLRRGMGAFAVNRRNTFAIVTAELGNVAVVR